MLNNLRCETYFLVIVSFVARMYLNHLNEQLSEF